MSDLVQFVLNSLPGSRVVEVINREGAQALSASGARRKRSRLTIADFDKKTKEKRDCPYGLARKGNNWLDNNSNAYNLKHGLINVDDIVDDFRKMLIRVDGARTPPLVNSDGEVKTFPLKSRWNREYNYSWIVGQRALDQVKGLKKITHLILTIAPDRIKDFIPDWWFYGDEEYMSIYGGHCISEFLRKLRAYKKKHGEPNNFVTWVMEFTQKGMVHFHLLFYGSWVASLDVLSGFWPYSDANGVRFGKPIHHQDNGAVLASYLTRYITKSLTPVDIDNKKLKKKMERIRAFLWFFKRRLYNMRHRVQNSDGEWTLGIGREQFVNPVRWRKYVPAFEILGNDCFLEEKEFLRYDFP